MSPTTITISLKTKKLLERIKGNKTWDSFLRELAMNYKRQKRAKLAAKYLKKSPMSDDEANKILIMIEEGRQSWRSRKN